MDTQSSDYGTNEARPDGATVELYTQSYSGGSGDTGSDQQISDKAGQMAQQAKDALGDTVDKVRGQAVSQIETQKSRATETLDSVAEAVRQTAGQLRQQNQAPIADVANTVADQISRVSTYLNNRDIKDISLELQHLARRQPAIFLGGAFMAGLLAARFLKSSPQQAQMGGEDVYGYGSNYGYSRYRDANYSGRSSSYSDYDNYSNMGGGSSSGMSSMSDMSGASGGSGSSQEGSTGSTTSKAGTGKGAARQSGRGSTGPGSTGMDTSGDSGDNAGLEAR